jgi:hypothetical protein
MRLPRRAFWALLDPSLHNRDCRNLQLLPFRVRHYNAGSFPYVLKETHYDFHQRVTGDVTENPQRALISPSIISQQP